MPTIISEVVNQILEEQGIIHPDAMYHIERAKQQKRLERFDRRDRKDKDI